MTYYPKARGGGDTYHDHWSDTPHGSNSVNGAHLAARKHKGWIDNDATRLKGFTLLNDHGWPLKVYFPHGTSIDFTWAQVKGRTYVHQQRTYHPRLIRDALVANAKTRVKGHPLGTEVEIKNLHPITPVEMERVMHQLAADMQAAYGQDWKRWCLVKVCTGGLAYKLEVCKAAHAAGIPTLISVQGKERFMSFAGHTEVTYLRGSLNPRIRRR